MRGIFTEFKKKIVHLKICYVFLIWEAGLNRWRYCDLYSLITRKKDERFDGVCKRIAWLSMGTYVHMLSQPNRLRQPSLSSPE